MIIRIDDHQAVLVPPTALGALHTARDARVRSGGTGDIYIMLISELYR